MFSSSFIVAFLRGANPVVAFTGFRQWTRRNLYHQVDLFSRPCYSLIIPGLYLGNARAAGDKEILRQLNITHVLSVESHRLPKSTFTDTNINNLFIRAHDSPQTNLMPYFSMSNAFINEGIQKGNVFVHCRFGVSRSATLVIAYVMEKYRLSFDQGFNFVRQRRPFINPNPGFVLQLQEYERLNYDVRGIQRFEAYITVNAREHKYKLVTAAAILTLGVLVPVLFLNLLQMPIPFPS